MYCISVNAYTNCLRQLSLYLLILTASDFSWSTKNRISRFFRRAESDLGSDSGFDSDTGSGPDLGLDSGFGFDVDPGLDSGFGSDSESESGFLTANEMEEV